VHRSDTGYCRECAGEAADALTTSVGLIAADAQVNVAAVTPSFVCAFILLTIVFMGFSFLIKND
jgi:hypothetical protein